MFAVPEHTVLRPVPHRPLSPTALVRAATAAGPPPPGPVPTGDPRATVWVTRLPPGAHLPVRDYEARQGAFAVVSGTVVELSHGGPRTLRPGQVRVFGPGYRHLVHNAGDEPAVAVHVQIDP